jgi:hypothetical protein
MGKDRRRRRSGFFIIFGWRVLALKDAKNPRPFTCPTCEREGLLISKVRRRWFTLFLLPVLPVDDGEPICQCSKCKAIFERPIEQMARSLGKVILRDWQHSLELYNQLRDNPTDGPSLLKLLECYDAMNESAEAISTARHFPQALASSPEAQTLLARLREPA